MAFARMPGGTATGPEKPVGLRRPPSRRDGVALGPPDIQDALMQQRMALGRKPPMVGGAAGPSVGGAGGKPIGGPPSGPIAMPQVGSPNKPIDVNTLPLEMPADPGGLPPWMKPDPMLVGGPPARGGGMGGGGRGRITTSVGPPPSGPIMAPPGVTTASFGGDPALTTMQVGGPVSATGDFMQDGTPMPVPGVTTAQAGPPTFTGRGGGTQQMGAGRFGGAPPPQVLARRRALAQRMQALQGLGGG